MASVGRNESCPCGSGKKFKRCCLNTIRDASLTGAVGEAGSAAQGELTIIVETERGAMVRTVPSASPLSPDMSHGSAAEAATQDAAAVWGLPDFVYLPATQRVGAATRELGDGLILVGKVGIVMQIKSRETPSPDPARELAWLEKKAAHALEQGLGTVRRMNMGPVELTSLRGRTSEIDASQYRWYVVVVLDHPDPPEDFTPTIANAELPTVVLLRRDWEFLFDQLKSTYAVAQYVERIAGRECALGREPARYYDLAQADAAARPSPFPPALLGAGRLVPMPLLPMAPAASDDRPAHALVRTLFEDIACTRLTNATEANRLHLLAELDKLPVGQRAGIGRFMLEAMKQVAAEGRDGIAWQLRTARGEGGRVHLGFGACSAPWSEDIQGMFSLWLQLRHYDVLAAAEDVEGLTSVAVLLTPRSDGRRPWDTTVAAVSGALNFSAAELEELREIWPTPSEREMAHRAK